MRIKNNNMENITTLQQAIEDLKLFMQPKTEGKVIGDDLAKQLASSFEMAYRSLTIDQNKTT